jgi:hypothetical protein
MLHAAERHYQPVNRSVDQGLSAQAERASMQANWFAR